MGLDAVELVLAVEERFGIAIADDDAEKLVTPGLLIDYVCRQLEMTDTKRCQSQQAFYLLRRTLMQRTGAKRSEITPQRRIRDFFPGTDHTRDWPSLQAAVWARGWPSLGRPRRLRRLLFVLSLAALAATIACCVRLHLRLGDIVSISLVAWAVSGVLLLISTRKQCISIPADLETLADLVPYVESSEEIRWDRGGVARAVREIVTRQLGLAPSRYAENARFVEDLGVD